MTNHNWTVDGETVQAESFEMVPQGVTLSFQVDRSNLSYWRQYDRADDIEVESGFAGSFRALDAGNAVTVTVEPPSDLSPPVDTFEGYVASYSEEQNSADRVTISLEVQRKRNRGQQFSTVTEPLNDVYISFANSVIQLRNRQMSRTGSDGTTADRSHTVTLRLSRTQAAVLADDADRPEAITEREVQGGINEIVDESDGRQTIELQLQSESVMPTGEFLITGWSLSPAQVYEPWLAEVEMFIVRTIFRVLSGETRTVNTQLTIDEDRAVIDRGGTFHIPRGTSATRERT